MAFVTPAATWVAVVPWPSGVDTVLVLIVTETSPPLQSESITTSGPPPTGTGGGGCLQAGPGPEIVRVPYGVTFPVVAWHERLDVPEQPRVVVPPQPEYNPVPNHSAA